MKFSIILPSLLSDYPGAATGRPAKLVRAVRSVLAQPFTDFELIVIADGCDLTEWIIKKKFNDPRIKTDLVLRRKLFSNDARNAGIAMAQGEYILYLDNDDMLGPDHLDKINKGLNGEDWISFSDFVPETISDNGEVKWKERTVDVTQYGMCGTSNICHSSRLKLKWEKDGYGHDFHFIQQLNEFKNNKFIGSAEYYVCHFNGMQGI